MRYTLNVPKSRYMASKWLWAMIIMGAIAVPLVIFDIHQMGLIIYALSGV